MPTAIRHSVDDVVARAAGLGPVKTVLRLCHVGDEDSPLARLSRAFESAEKRLAKTFGDDEFAGLLAALGAAFRMVRKFFGAAHFFHRAGRQDELADLGELAYEFGALRAVVRLDEYAGREGRPGRCTTPEALREFIVTKAIPAIDIGGSQFHGFTLDERALNELASAAPQLDFSACVTEAVLRLERMSCPDVAKLYVLATRSNDAALMQRCGDAFAAQAARPRRRAVELVTQAFPDHRVTVVRQGDTASIRPRQRFVFDVQRPDGSRCVVKELLAPACDGPASTEAHQEAAVLQHCTIPGIPRCHERVDIEGLSFIRICHLPGERLSDLLGRRRLPFDEALEVCRGLATIVAGLHEAGVAHFDLQDANVLWDGTSVSVVGFDHARFCSETDEPWTLPSYAPFVAPETAARFRAGQAADDFQLGLLVHRLTAGRHPFGRPAVPTPPAGHPHLMLLEYALPALYLPPTIDPDLPPRLGALTGRLLDTNPVRRATAAEARDILDALAGGG